jgi:hypothetical protein
MRKFSPQGHTKRIFINLLKERSIFYKPGILFGMFRRDVRKRLDVRGNSLQLLIECGMEAGYIQSPISRFIIGDKMSDQ